MYKPNSFVIDQVMIWSGKGVVNFKILITPHLEGMIYLIRTFFPQINSVAHTYTCIHSSVIYGLSSIEDAEEIVSNYAHQLHGHLVVKGKCLGGKEISRDKLVGYTLQ